MRSTLPATKRTIYITMYYENIKYCMYKNITKKYYTVQKYLKQRKEHL